MQTRNQAFENSLRCLQHPATLLSIALLLFNDHVLKIISPSWLTGKVSDFAGLFFFPFIITAILSTLLNRLNLKHHVIRNTAFGLVAIWFVLFKTVSSVNDASVIFISNLLGKPVQLLLDVTDLLALAMLYPSWLLWQQSSVRKSRRLSYVPLLLGIFASLATSPAPPQVEVVTHLKVINGHLFALDSTNWTMAISDDGGKTWKWTDEIESGFFPIEPVPLPITICSQNQRNACYRIDGKGNVEFSNNGGNSWVISWKLPDNRLSFIERIDSDINLGPYDLLATKWENSEYLLIAAGEEGVLRKELPDGEWERIQVQNAEPSPYKATSISNAFSIVWVELLIWFLVSILVFIVACWIIWSSNSKISSQHLSKMQWVFLPALSPIISIFSTLFIQTAIGLFFYLIFQLPIYDNNFEGILLVALVVCLVAALLTLPAIVYLRLNQLKSILINHNYPPQIASNLVWRSYLTHISVFSIGTINWIFWAMGVISKYEVTWISAVLSAGAVAIVLIRNIADISKQNTAI